MDGLALVEALWARMCAGIREDGTLIEPNDPFWDQLYKVAEHAKSNPVIWLEMRQTYGDLADHPQFVEAFSDWLKLIWSAGVRAALKTYCGLGEPHC